jgi:hypothetical protein
VSPYLRIIIMNIKQIFQSKKAKEWLNGTFTSHLSAHIDLKWGGRKRNFMKTKSMRAGITIVIANKIDIKY